MLACFVNYSSLLSRINSKASTVSSYVVVKWCSGARWYLTEVTTAGKAADMGAQKWWNMVEVALATMKPPPWK